MTENSTLGTKQAAGDLVTLEGRFASTCGDSASAPDFKLSALPGPSRDTILAFQNHLAQLEQRDCPLKHAFAPGMYAREILLPAETFIVGKIHKHAHLNIVTRGRCTVVTEFGRREIDASAGPVTFTSDAGSKRALYVHEETVWTTIHAVQSTDLAEIERDIIAPDYPELDAFMARECERLMSASEREGRLALRHGSPSPQEPQPLSVAAHPI